MGNCIIASPSEVAVISGPGGSRMVIGKGQQALQQHATYPLTRGSRSTYRTKGAFGQSTRP